MADEYADGVDFALVAYREEGVWQVVDLARERLGEMDGIEDLAAELRRYPGDFGSLALVSVDEDFFVIMRVAGASVRLLLSDVTAATEWPLAQAVLDELDLPEPEDDDDPDPAGDLGIFDDLGVSALELGALLDDAEAYPDELLGDIARRLGFGEQYDELAGVGAS